MSMVLFIIGGIAVMAGAAMFAFGMPINEFSFGNTLIVAGTTLASGGLIVIALAVAVKQLQSIAETLTARAPVQAGRPHEGLEQPLEARLAPGAGRVPFPPKPRPEQAPREPYPAEPPMPMPMAADRDTELDEERRGPSFAPAKYAPALRNPEGPPVTVEDEVSLSPHYPVGAPAPGDVNEPTRSVSSPTNGSSMAESRQAPAFDAPWRSAPPPPPPHEAPSSYFDSMWPAKPSRGPGAGEPQGEPKPVLPSRETIARAPAPEPRPASQPRTVAILKSGVVDGMGYTLYVDGSIEAELPQGTLRFASIDELRSHLEQNP